MYVNYILVFVLTILTAQILNFHLYFVDPNNLIRQLFSDTTPDDPWSVGGFHDAKYVIGKGSPLASYGKACLDCMHSSTILVYHDHNSELQMISGTGESGTKGPILIDGKAVNVSPGSSLAFAPISFESSTNPKIALYCNIVQLTELHYNGTIWEKAGNFPYYMNFNTLGGA